MALAALPPGPEGHYLTGNLLVYKRDPLGFLTQCSWEYGDVVRLSLSRPTYLLNHPDYIEYVLVKNNSNFTKNSSRYLHRYRQETIFIGNSLLTIEGEFWRRQRRLLQPAFHRQRINAYGEVMVSCTERMLATWEDGETRDIHQEMMGLLLEIVTKALFDTVLSGKSEEVMEAYEQVAKTFGGQGGGIQLQEGFRGILLRFLDYLRFCKEIRQLNKITYDAINERRNSSENTGDLLSMLLHFQDEDGNQMSDKQLRDEVVTMLFAGHETAANSLSWTWYLLSKHPEIETKLLEELQEVLGDRVPTAEDLPRLRYTEMVVKESMRLYPPVWNIGRRAKEECEIGGYHVPSGTQLFLSQWVMHRDPRYFEDPGVFSPDRWEDGFAKRIPKYAYFPFGGGPRQCIGSLFAMMEAILVLATIAKKFQPKLVSEQRMIPRPGVTLHPKGGIKMILKKRPPKGYKL
jgi:cytochrome P450